MKRRTAQYLSFIMAAYVVSGCSGQMNKTTAGTLTGGTLGAGLGAIIGDQTGHAGPGIAIGAAAGALGGALLGNQLDQVDEEHAATRSRIENNQRMIDENRQLIEELKLRGADVRSTDRGVVVNLPDVLFEFNKHNLTQGAKRTVGDIAGVLKGTERIISVEGHTDSVGSVSYNKQLSVDRAESVARELENGGISGTKMRVRGFGEGRPIATNEESEGRARNRRVEVIIEN